MLSKNKIKLIKSLETKKFRQETGLFVIEGSKMVLELLNSDIKTELLFATENWLDENTHLKKQFPSETEIVNNTEINKISFLNTPQEAIAVAKIPFRNFNLNSIANKLSLFLDRIQDPGNLGTIIRIADWFGIDTIVCSTDTTDIYNPKVVQSTMGAIFRVEIIYRDLIETFNEITSLKIPVYGTLLDGENIYCKELESNGIILMGNESKGISKQLIPFVNEKILIPSFPADNGRSESLNVGVATAIVCAEFRRRLSH